MVKILDRRSALLGSLLMTIGLMAWIVMAGSAAQAGAAGVGVGNAAFTVLAPTPPCSAFNQVVLTVGQTGTYSAGDPAAGASASYTGSSTMTATVSSAFYESPLGTHGTDNTCSPWTAGTVIPATVQVSGSMSGGSVNCGPVTGDYSRTHAEVTVKATHACTVTAGTISATETMTQTSIGLYDTCTGGGPPTGCTYKGTFGDYWQGGGQTVSSQACGREEDNLPLEGGADPDLSATATDDDPQGEFDGIGMTYDPACSPPGSPNPSNAQASPSSPSLVAPPARLPSCRYAKIRGEGGPVEFQQDPVTKSVAWRAWMWEPRNDYGYWYAEWFHHQRRVGKIAPQKRWYPPHHTFIAPQDARPGAVLTVMGWHTTELGFFYRIGGQCRVPKT